MEHFNKPYIEVDTAAIVKIVEIVFMIVPPTVQLKQNKEKRNKKKS